MLPPSEGHSIIGAYIDGVPKQKVVNQMLIVKGCLLSMSTDYPDVYSLSHTHTQSHTHTHTVTHMLFLTHLASESRASPKHQN